MTSVSDKSGAASTGDSAVESENDAVESKNGNGTHGGDNTATTSDTTAAAASEGDGPAAATDTPIWDEVRRPNTASAAKPAAPEGVSATSTATDAAVAADERAQPAKVGFGATRAGRVSGIVDAVERRFGTAALAFVVVAGVFGALFAVATPPFWGHDEITQFGRAYQVAHGGFTPEQIADDRDVAYGGQVPTSIDALMSYAFGDYNNNPEEPDPMVADPGVYDRLGAAPVTSETRDVWFTNTAAYSPVPYIPAALGIRLSEALDLSVGALNTVTRLSGLLAYVLIVGFALRTLRGHRVQWLAFTVAVLPIAVFQAGTVTADTMTNALAILVSALLVKGLFLGDRLTRPETVAALTATVLLPISKPTYVLLAMLTVLIPARRYGLRGPLRFLPWVVAAVGAGVFAAWMKVAAPTGEGMSLMRPRHQWGTVRPGDQLSEILSDPLRFLSVFGDSVWLRDQRWFTQFFGELGFAYIDVPAITMLACLLAFAVSVGIADRLPGASNARTAIVALTVLASVAMIYVTLYMSFTPVGYYIIDGVQGRYFVPLAIAAMAVVLRWMPLRLTDSEGRTPSRGPAVVIVAATVFALVTAAAKYCSIVWG
ncbi:DUF2142 domain-containing protein [Nocardia otitidiscaviarum]|uniref:DUF2142 domain-containing protein n=1 Tax=Nocardia otitidiscaviarum TaxID=1823 RepID=UPI0009DF6015|nr:DUF2142 domain-containing protein [Nocardia otitidiscaviarum]MBF6136053.1 DUF2142 domain-containing protein [Nocardia otitidiscaviarum]MBF6483810.1 DUF2142 domain-containing protein [Nocardia otitidiscaviarum]